MPGVWWPAEWKVSWLATAALVVLLTAVYRLRPELARLELRAAATPFAEVVALALIFGVKFRMKTVQTFYTKIARARQRPLWQASFGRPLRSCKMFPVN